MTRKFIKEELVDEYGDNHLSFHLDKQITLQKTGQRITTPKREELSFEGDGKNSYITIISANFKKKNKSLIIETGSSLGQLGKAEIDILPLNSTENFWLEAGYNAAALAEKSTQGGRRNILILTERAKGDLFLNSVENYYTAKLNNGVNIILDSEKPLYFVKDKIVGDINVYPRSVNPNLKVLETGELEVSAVLAKHKEIISKDVYEKIKKELVIVKQEFGNTVQVSESGGLEIKGAETVYEKYHQVLKTNESINNLELMQVAEKFLKEKTPCTGIEKINEGAVKQVQISNEV